MLLLGEIFKPICVSKCYKDTDICSTFFSEMLYYTSKGQWGKNNEFFQEDHCLQYVYPNAVKEMTWGVCVSIMLYSLYYTYKL